MPPPRPAERLRALRWEVNEERDLLHRCVRMSRVIAAREKISEGRGLVFCDFQVLSTGLVLGVAGEGEDSMEEEEEDEEEEKEFDEVIDAIDRRG